MPRALEPTDADPRALENAFADLVLGPEVDPDDRDQVSDWLARNEVAEDDARAIEERSLPRMMVYRQLVRNTLTSAIRMAAPRTLARLGDQFGEYFDRFLAERAPQTHYLRDVTTEFLDFCAPLWAEDSRVSAYLTDLARHEASRIQIAAHPARQVVDEPGALDLDRGVRFIEALMLAHYRWAIHELPDDEDDRSAPAERPVHLLVYRDPAHEVRYLETTEAAARILRKLLDGATLKDAVVAAAEGDALLPDQSVLEGTARLLADLAERGAMIGAAE